MASASTHPSNRSQLGVRGAAVATAFLLNGLSFGVWAARIPAVQAQTHLDEAGLGFALLGAAIGAVRTMPMGGAPGSRSGPHVIPPLPLIGGGAREPLVGGGSVFRSLFASLF